ncbi:Contactin-associated protein-like 5 [Collichthys lucidus]|uniref:Contactin-associated protein-like 5 n=1 Tax=Collichthys lucidus TaxID=240159 RepID=A0A4U5U341_COLLU|nr:Contactin-associated protein-like 5 [Collichthys lucidus]
MPEPNQPNQRKATRQSQRQSRTFVGNVNSEAVVQNKLSHSVRTRILRFVPLDWNPSGWLCLRVEVYGCSYKSDVADFDGRSSLLYRFNQKSMSTVKDVISLRFKSRQAEGVLLHGEGQRGDYITLELHRGKLALYLNLDDTRLRFSSSRVAVTVGSLLDDQHWHSVIIERFNKQVNLTVDSHTQHFQTKGEGDSLEVDYELSFGGIPLPGKPGTFLRKNFHGCMENLYYNGINIIDLAKRRKPQIYSVLEQKHAEGGFIRKELNCCEPIGKYRCSLTLIHLMLLNHCSPPHLSLAPKPSNTNQRKLIGHRVNDGLWHSVSLDARSLQITLTLDSEPASTIEQWEQLEAGGSFYFGGCPPEGCQNPTLAFQGCMRLISINSQPINLNHVQQGLLGNYNDLQFDTCNIRDRCLPNLCEHGGRCWQSWSSFSCDCSGTGYSGATCHNSIYESSCEAYKLIGSSSGFYSIDPDGSGPLGPTPVYCNMTGGTVSHQRGFLGCISTLTINGVTFDLEGKAKTVPGVSSGCPGYCSGSSSLCHNRGRCIEKSNGYTCDCSQSAYGGPTCKEEVSVSFDRESSVTFTFQEPFSVMQNRSSQASSVPRQSSSRAREDMAFTFITSQSPAMLLTVSTFSQQYIAVILAHNGSLQIWYHLQTHRIPDVFSPILSSLADGRIHRIRIHREGKDLYVQIDQDIHRKYTLSSDAELILIRSLTLGKVIRRDSFQEEVVQAGSKGFVGCLSSVQFNHVAPLKAALLNRGSSLVTIRGPLVQSNCGALADSITSHNLRDQVATTNKDKEHGGDTQSDLAVIAGLQHNSVSKQKIAIACRPFILYPTTKVHAPYLVQRDVSFFSVLCSPPALCASPSLSGLSASIAAWITSCARSIACFANGYLGVFLRDIKIHPHRRHVDSYPDNRVLAALPACVITILFRPCCFSDVGVFWPNTENALLGHFRPKIFSASLLSYLTLYTSVVTAVVFITVCVLAVVTRLLYRRRTQRTNDSITEKENRHSMETENRTEMHLHSSVRDTMKEYYI